MKRIWWRRLAVLLAAAMFAGCSFNRANGPHYSGWGGCCSHGAEHAEAIHSGAAGVPMMPAAPANPGGYPIYMHTPHAPATP